MSETPIKFTKRSITVMEAIQFNGTKRWVGFTPWLIAACRKAPSEIGSIEVLENIREARLRVSEDRVLQIRESDWVFLTQDGDLYSWSDTIMGSFFGVFTAEPAETP